MNKEDLDKMTIRQIFEISKNIPIKEGGLGFILEKIVMCIEELEGKNETRQT